MKIRYLEPTFVICPNCNGTGWIKGLWTEDICPTCSGSGEVLEERCIHCGESWNNCSCFPPEDLPSWCSLDPSSGIECPADEEKVAEAIETLLIACQECLYNVNFSRKAA